jgi:hypothetical protein
MENVNFKQMGYRKTHPVPQMIKDLEQDYYQQKMVGVQQDEFKRIKSSYIEKGHVQDNQRQYINRLYLDLVLTPVKKEVKPIGAHIPQHIGMRMAMGM